MGRGIGAFEVVIRIDGVDLLDNGRPLGGGDIRTIMIGLNWYANGHVKVLINAGTFSFDDVGAADKKGTQAGLRVEVGFKGLGREGAGPPAG